jgi:hypothetical protein
MQTKHAAQNYVFHKPTFWSINKKRTTMIKKLTEYSSNSLENNLGEEGPI